MEVLNVSKSFDGVKVLDNVSISIPQGRRIVISGASGRGKTTLLNIMMGILKPDSGKMSDVPKRISAVFQEDRLPKGFTPIASVKMTAPKSVTREEIISHLNEVGLAEQINKPVESLSGGERRRIAIVRAIIVKPDAVFLDEPFTGLDSETKKKICEYINRYTMGRTVIAVSHDDVDAELLKAEKIRI